MDYSRLKTKQEQLERQATLAAHQNRNLEKEISKLKSDIEYIKHLARHEHDMVGPDELVFKEKTKNQGSEK